VRGIAGALPAAGSSTQAVQRSNFNQLLEDAMRYATLTLSCLAGVLAAGLITGGALRAADTTESKPAAGAAPSAGAPSKLDLIKKLSGDWVEVGHQATIVWKDDNHIHSEWEMVKDGKNVMTASFELARK
jgi:hypothetical protein